MREKKFAGVDNWRSRLVWGVLLAVVIFFLAIKPEEVQADLILEPEDQFYQAHADQCEYVDRSYYTDGSVDFWTAPNGRKKGSFPADTRLQITHVYTDSQGAQWGVFLDQKSGWILMADVYLDYDSRQFREDHEEEILPGEEQVLAEGERVVFWSYPCSGENWGTEELQQELKFSEFYTDSQERLWGNVGYYMGSRDFWICLSEPGNQEIPMEEEPPKVPGQAVVIQGQTAKQENAVSEETLEKIKEQGSLPVWIFALPALLTVAVAGGCIWFFWLRKK